jgi:hypothetical protein
MEVPSDLGGLIASMGSRGDADDRPCENCIGGIKVEWIKGTATGTAIRPGSRSSPSIETSYNPRRRHVSSSQA